MACTLTPHDYIAWVQRSLNRLVGASLRDDGCTSPLYRILVAEFKFLHRLCLDSKVNEAMQDAIIRANHEDSDYMAWVDSALAGTAGKVAATAHDPTGSERMGTPKVPGFAGPEGRRLGRGQDGDGPRRRVENQAPEE